MFDVDRYISEQEHARQIKVLKPPNNKVPPVNLPKLAFDKKLVPIVVSSDINYQSSVVGCKIRWQVYVEGPL